MPFTSQKQRRLFYALKNKGEMKQSTIDRWNDETKAAQGRGDLPEKLPKYVDKKASIASMIGHRYNSEQEVSTETKERLLKIVTKQAATGATVVDAGEFPGAKSYLAAKRYFAGKKMKPSTAAMLVAAPALPLAVTAAMHLRKNRQQEKTAAFPPSLTKSLLGAINGAVAGALIGSRRSLDDQTVRGMVQGALTGALAGGAAAQATGSRAAQFAAGGVGGYLASRGPLGPSRPQVHVRLDQNNTGEAPGATEKMMDVAERIQSKLASSAMKAWVGRHATNIANAVGRMTKLTEDDKLALSAMELKRAEAGGRAYVRMSAQEIESYKAKAKSSGFHAKFWSDPAKSGDLVKQIAAESRDPRLYSNIKGTLAGKSRDERVAAHGAYAAMGGGDGTVLGAMRAGIKKVAGLNKEAISRSTIASAAAKRGVSPDYLKSMAKSRVGRSFGSTPEAIKQRFNARDSIGSGAGERYLKSWLSNKPHMKAAGELRELMSAKMKSRRLRQAAMKKSAEEANANQDRKPTPASVSIHYKKKFFGPGMKQTGKTITVYGGVAPKIAEMNPHLSHGLELGGLGILAAHPVSTLRDPKASKKDKHIAKLETAGLGVLAVPALHHFGSRAIKAMRKSAGVSDWIKANPRKALAAELNKSAADQVNDDEQGLKSMALMNMLRRRPRGALIAGDVNARNGTAVEALQKAMRK